MLNLLAVIQSKAGRFDEAKATSRRVATIDPGNVDAQVHLARIELARPHGDLKVATQILLAVLGHSPKIAPARLEAAPESVLCIECARRAR